MSYRNEAVLCLWSRVMNKPKKQRVKRAMKPRVSVIPSPDDLSDIYEDEPDMSCTTLLVTIEDLISIAFGNFQTNTVNFKMVQTVLHILARQMRMLGQRVELRISDVDLETEDSSRDKKPDGAERKMKDKKGKTGAQKDKGKDKDRGKTEKEADKDVDKEADINVDKEKEKEDEKGAKKGKQKAGKKAKEGRDASKGRTDSASSVTISEVERKNEKVLVVEKGQPTHTDASRTRVGSIEVVTLSQFAILQEAVKELKQKTGPIPPVTLPDNEKLRTDIAKGSASLTDTMQAMQVNARIKAAEQAVDRMAGLLTQLAAAGALPQELADKVAEVKFAIGRDGEETISSKSRPTTAGSVRKTVAIHPSVPPPLSLPSRMDPQPSVGSQKSVVLTSTGRPSVVSLSRPSILSRASLSTTPLVTHTELSDAMHDMRSKLMKEIGNMTSRATSVAETASTAARSVVDRLDVAINLDKRITTLYSLVSDYSEQLSGFDAGLATSMQSFQEQMMQMRDDLKNGLSVMDQATNNGETAAVMELSERCAGLALELEQTTHAHSDLLALQGQLGNELKSLVECVEMLREQKADRDEVLDGLRDKADTSRLTGLVREEQFQMTRDHLEAALLKSYQKFQLQEAVWMKAIADLTSLTQSKAEVLDLLAERDKAQHQLRELDEKLYQLAVQIGEPKTALLTRALSRGAVCGACAVPALMEPHDVNSHAPPSLPALRPPTTLDLPCKPDWMDVHPTTTTDTHVCRRWVGGSHTLVSVRDGVVTREPSHAQLHNTPTRQYTGYGNDGRLYMMEEELQPCVECNKLSTDVDEANEIAADGAGDRGPRTSTILIQ